MRRDIPHILLINPWIHDFAAYDFWAKPLGLLALASILKNYGYHVTYLDCLDRFHPKMPKTNPFNRDGRGPYLKMPIQKPRGLEDISRNFSRYGIRRQWFKDDLLSLRQPDLILITSMMTYWYPGVQETINVTKEIFPHVPIILGGIYASLCHDHAVINSGSDRVVTGSGEEQILKIAGDYTNFSGTGYLESGDLDTYPYPAFELQGTIGYIPLLTSRGCPFACKYCASHFLNPKRMTRSPEYVVEEIKYWHEKHGVIDFVFYDDALLVNAENHAIPILEGIINEKQKVRFHTPNAVHISQITKKVARLMFQAGFKTLRLGLETALFEKRQELDQKLTEKEFKKAISCLLEAGFNRDMLGAYLMVGLPGQDMKSIETSIQTVKHNGITPVLAYYSPIPHTAWWDQAVNSSRYDLESDPVFTNNAILPCQQAKFSWENISYLKSLTTV